MINFSLPSDVYVTMDTSIENEESYSGVKYTSYILDLDSLLNPYLFVIITIAPHERDIMGGLARIREIDVDTLKGLGYLSVSRYDREFDGHPGSLAVGESLTLPFLYSAVYLLDNQTPVKIDGTLPWDEGSSMIVNTIHVEKVNI